MRRPLGSIQKKKQMKKDICVSGARKSALPLVEQARQHVLTCSRAPRSAAIHPPQGGLCPRRQRLMFRHTPVSSGACAETHASNGSRSDTHGSRPPRAAGNPRLSRAMDAAAEKRAPQRNIENMYEESNPREAESYKVNFRALTPALLRREKADHA